jgi:hypothetical protein
VNLDLSFLALRENPSTWVNQSTIAWLSIAAVRMDSGADGIRRWGARRSVGEH